MRNAFADEITALGQADPRIVLLSGDIGNRLFDRFKDVAPGRFFNCGVAEANMMGVAAGLGLNKLRPVVYTIAPFTTIRCLEQIKIDVCYHGSPVIFVGTGAGLSYAQLGPTHHSLEDVAILRALPGLTIFCPCDSHELRAGLRAALQGMRPVYIRIGKKGEPTLHTEIPTLELGKALTLRQGDDLCFIGTGPITGVALAAAEELAKQGVSARVESFHTVKPLDEERLLDLSSRFGLLAVVEEHSRIGGLYSAISEWQIRHALEHPTRQPLIASFALEDAFIHRVGSQEQTRMRAELNGTAVAGAILEILRNAEKGDAHRPRL
jgi:transketolase